MMWSRGFRIAGLFVLGALLACSEDEPLPPNVRLLRADPETGGGVTFEAEATSLGLEPIIDHGFIWYEEGRLPTVASLGPLAAPVKFTVQVTTDLVRGIDYTVQAFIQSDLEYTFSDTVVFRSTGSKEPVISEITPTEGGEGEELTILGSNFTSIRDDVNVWVGPLLLYSKHLVTPDSIIVAFADRVLICGTYEVTMKIRDKTLVAEQEFDLLCPELTGVDPQQGGVGDVITVSGKNLAADPSRYRSVLIGGATATVVSATTDQFQARIGQYFQSGPASISIRIDQKESNVLEGFRLNDL